MFRNYLLIAIRSFWKNKVFSLINIAGLAIGISASLVIYLLVRHEFGFERFQENADRVYRVVTNMHFPDQDFKNSGVPGPLPAAFRNEVPGIEESAVFWIASPTTVTIPTGKERKAFRKQKKIIYADDAYFRMIPYEWIAGAPASVLSEPNRVVLTESRARAYFPFASSARELIGQTIIYDDTLFGTVSGVVKDLAKTTDFTFEEFVSLSTYRDYLKKDRSWDNWGSVSSSSQFFVRLKPGVEPGTINKALAQLRSRHSDKNDMLPTDHFLQRLDNIHFNADFDAFGQRQAHRPTLYALMAVAGFLLLLGCINFINLTTAHASQRAREIGIRKTMGSSGPQLILQFLSETLLMTSVSAALSVLLTPLLLQLFSGFIPEGLQLNIWREPAILGFLVALVLAVTVIAGIYPAFVLSGYRPVAVLKNLAYAHTGQSRRLWIRKTLTVSQFVIAQFLIIATLVVGKQLKYSLNKELGFKKDAIVNVETPYDFQNPGSKQALLMQKVRTVPGIQQISLSGRPPASEGSNFNTMDFVKDGRKIETTAEVIMADTNYINLYKIRLIAGRNLRQTDEGREYLVNETYARMLGYQNPADVIGKTFSEGGNQTPVVGVFADVHTKSMHRAIQPLALKCQAKGHTTFHIALDPSRPESWQAVTASIGRAFREVFPDEEFRYSFFDESIAGFYKREKEAATLMTLSAGLAIFISCLGLLGLVIFTTTQRTREIGVRKVLGASVSQVVTMLSRDFMWLVFLGCILSAPLSWWACSRWLEGFAYKTPISWQVFFLGGLIMFLVAMITLSVQTIRAAMANPVKSLRTE